MRVFLLWLSMSLLPIQALAQALEERVVRALQSQGFTVTQMDRTWLGRLWVVAESESLYREMIFDPATGEVLQDYVILLADHQRQLAEREADQPDDRPASAVDRTVPMVAEDWADVVSEPENGVIVDLPPPQVTDGE